MAGRIMKRYVTTMRTTRIDVVLFRLGGLLQARRELVTEAVDFMSNDAQRVDS